MNKIKEILIEAAAVILIVLRLIFVHGLIGNMDMFRRAASGDSYEDEKYTKIIAFTILNLLAWSAVYFHIVKYFLQD